MTPKLGYAYMTLAIALGITNAILLYIVKDQNKANKSYQDTLKVFTAMVRDGQTDALQKFIEEAGKA